MTAPDHSTNRWGFDVTWPASGRQRVYDLAHQLHTGIPHHPNHPPYSFTLTKQHGEVMYPEGVSAAAEMITTGGHVGTHMDGFAHVSRLGKIYGGHDIVENQSYAGGVEVQSVHEMAPVLAPGHLVDMPTLLGRELTPDDGVSAEHLDAWFAGHPAPAPGTVVLVRTGWDRHWVDNATFLGTSTGAPGMSLSGARWLTDHGILASGTDTVAYEQQPAPTLPVHCHLLVDNGVPIMEAMHLAPLVEAKVWDFFFVAAPLPIRGGTGSPIRPLAFVTES
jgi:kynurenine formamidase